MISYATIGVVDMEVSMKFYDAVMGALGSKRAYSGEGFASYKNDSGEQTLWICHPYNKEQARAGNGIMIGFSAPSRAAVDAFHAAALANGGCCEGKPGLRDYGPDIYMAYVRDPVGNKIAAQCLARE